MAPIFKSLAVFLSLTSILVLAAPLDKRQGAGTGAACNSVLSSTDNGVGFGVENIENKAAGTIGSTGVKAKRNIQNLARRQGDKIANGAGNVLTAAGQPGFAGVVATNGDNVDGQLTGDQAQVGAQIGADEETLLEGATAAAR